MRAYPKNPIRKISKSWKNRTFEKFGGTEVLQKNMKIKYDGTYEKIGGSEVVRKNMKIRTNGTSEKIVNTRKKLRIM